MKILVIESNLSETGSLSFYATCRFIEEYKKLHPNDEFEILNLNNETKLQTCLTSKNFSSYWNNESQKYIDLLNSADKIIINSPMINFTISPILKNFLDNVLQAGKTFKYKYDKKGSAQGLINSSKKILLILAQGSYKKWYKFSAFDDYLVSIIRFMGIENISTLLYDGTKTPKQKDLSVEDKFNLKIKKFYKILEKF